MKKGIAALKRYRTERRLTQAELGRELGVTAQTIWRYERGGRIPARRELPLIAEKTGIPIADLLVLDDCEAAT